MTRQRPTPTRNFPCQRLVSARLRCRPIRLSTTRVTVTLSSAQSSNNKGSITLPSAQVQPGASVLDRLHAGACAQVRTLLQKRLVRAIPLEMIGTMTVGGLRALAEEAGASGER